MKVIIGLGNPGQQYTNTRHNVGFFLLDQLQQSWQTTPWSDSRFSGVVSEGVWQGEKIILLKPTTYMNLSGESVSKIAHFYKLDPKEDVIVLVDDLDMEFGKVRYRASGSSGGQNGIKSLIQHLGTEEFHRIKIGIGRDSRFEVTDWVLSRFSIEEIEYLTHETFPLVEQKITNFLS